MSDKYSSAVIGVHICTGKKVGKWTLTWQCFRLKELLSLWLHYVGCDDFRGSRIG